MTRTEQHRCSVTSRRAFLASTAVAGVLGEFWTEQELCGWQRNIRTESKPSDLKITDLRFAHVIDAPMRCPLIRIDTNQDICGLGEVRDGASPTYAMMLKSRLIGENPCNVDRIFRKIKQFGFHARQAGGVCGVEMALWDLAGKAYGVPVFQMLGGKFRDDIRLYCDTTQSPDPEVYAARLKARRDDGFTFLKMDLGIGLVDKVPGCVTAPLGVTQRSAGLTQHMFTGMELTEKGVTLMADYCRAVREAVGWDVPLAADHFGHIVSVASATRSLLGGER